MKAVILAGGKGRRLLPFTTNFPKPLMPIGDKPILAIVMEKLKKSGVENVIITTGHLEDLIRLFFTDGSKFGVNITYSKEEEPLGTAGPLNLIRDQLNETFIMMNGDVLSDLDLNKLISFHKERNSIATVVLTKRTVHIDFGVVDINEQSHFSEWKEKPTIEYLVSTGIYLFEPEALESLPKEGFFNLPDFVENLHKDGKTVNCYVHDGYWLDIGRPEDYEKACIDFGD